MISVLSQAPHAPFADYTSNAFFSVLELGYRDHV